MIFLRKILFPFAILYGWIIQFRNFLYDKGILKSYSFDIPIIAVGNLSVGGTGKTPQIEYLIRLLSTGNKVATLSRGYKRKSKGFLLANENSTAASLGDEPYQMHLKFPNIQVAVDADRKNGIEQLLGQNVPPEIIVLDDAFQHRRVKAGMYILLTTYDELYIDDCLLPTGNLRESRSGVNRADVIIVTKCPATLSEQEVKAVKCKLNIEKPLFFSTVSYDNSVFSSASSLAVSDLKSISKLLVAGIAKPEPFFAYLQNGSDQIMEFSDHHHYSESDIESIIKRAEDKLVVTTEKDFVRLKDTLPSNQLYYLPIKTMLISDDNQLDQIILNYVRKSTRNR
jgi:tetraacyldisaccharide 4'-kinase